MITNKLLCNKWINRWAGSYTFISCYFWARQYKQSLNDILGIGFDNSLFIHKKGTASFYVQKVQFEKLGKFLAHKATDKIMRTELLARLVQNTDKIISIMDELDSKIPTVNEFSRFMEVFEKHLAFHVFMKKTVDFLDDKSLNEMLPEFKKARIYSEPVYSRTELFFRNLAKVIGEKENISNQLLTCLSQKELTEYLNSGILPSEKVLAERFDYSIIIFSDNKVKVFTGKEAEEIEQGEFTANQKDKISVISGVSASPGKIKGIARIVLDPYSNQTFNQGDILITGMTRPEFSIFVGKAGAIITDAGGRLCHAAIIAREQNIPCIVGTENATKVIKENDMLEIDANTGIVRIIK